MRPERNGPMRITTYVESLREAVEQEMERDPAVMLFGLDVDDHKAIQGSTRGLLERFGSERVQHEHAQLDPRHIGVDWREDRVDGNLGLRRQLAVPERVETDSRGCGCG